MSVEIVYNIREQNNVALLCDHHNFPNNIVNILLCGAD